MHSRRLHLHPRWNANPAIWGIPPRYLPYSPQEIEEARNDPAIVHFVGPHKPWHYRCRHCYRADYFAYLEQTPWRGRPTEGWSPWQVLLRPLPWLWTYRIELAVARSHRQLGAARGQLGAARRQLGAAAQRLRTGWP